MQFRRRNLIVSMICLALALGTWGCRSETERRLGQGMRRELQTARAAAARWESERADALSDMEIVALGYLERLRLGLGSPFRLVDYALADPRLADTLRTRLAFALLERVLEGEAYQIDPVILERMGTLGGAHRPGARQLALMAQLMDDATEPRAAETALRLAYTIAAAEGLVSREAPALAAAVAALLADRALARADAGALLAAASDQRSAPQLLRQWRAERRFAVEQPRLGPLTADLELEAIRGAAFVLGELREWALETARAENAESAAGRPTHLLPRLVQRFEQVEAQLAAPPQTPIVITARQIAREADQLLWLNRDQRAARTTFSQRARNEESFIIAQARLHEVGEHGAASYAALQAAVALRAYAQESSWFPGMDGPSQRDLQEQYGLAEVSFDRSVRASWRPYYRRMLASALDDLRRVLPALDLRGLRIHFGSTPAHTDALALHDPSARRLILPPLTSAGTLAHEVAHDIDWQVALRRYRIRGDYATDRAARNRSDPLAAQVRSLASVSAVPTAQEAPLSSHARRPAEVFARGVEWYVAVSLASAGRRNGYLSSVQDEVITGYGTVRPPDVSGAAGDALMDILSALAPVYREQRQAYRALYGTARKPRAYDLVRRVVEAPGSADPSRSLADQLDVLRDARRAALADIEGPACAPALISPTELQAARRKLVMLASTARARGLAVRQLQRSAPGAARHVLIRQLYRGPLPFAVDSLLAQQVAPVAAAVESFAAEPTSAPDTSVMFTHWTRCSTGTATLRKAARD
jgi:hypothetical protein